MEKLIRISNRQGQCSITIPISIAEKTGLNKVSFAMVTINKDNNIEVRKIDIIKKEER